MPSWLPGALIGATAVVVSVVSFWSGRARDRRDLLLKVHYDLISSESQRARALLHKVARQEEQPWWEFVDEDVRHQVNRIFSLWDIIGLQVKAGHIRRADLLALWDKALADAFVLGGPYVEYRRLAQNTGWEHYRSLAKAGHLSFKGRIASQPAVAESRSEAD